MFIIVLCVALIRLCIWTTLEESHLEWIKVFPNVSSKEERLTHTRTHTDMFMHHEDTNIVETGASMRQWRSVSSPISLVSNQAGIGRNCRLQYKGPRSYQICRLPGGEGEGRKNARSTDGNGKTLWGRKSNKNVEKIRTTANHPRNQEL